MSSPITPTSLISPTERIAVIGKKINNLGDLAAAAKVAHLLVEKKLFSPDQVILATDDSEGLSLFNRYQLKTISFDQLKQEPSIALQIYAPMDSLSSAQAFLVNRAPLLALYEYDFDCKPVITPLVEWVRAYSLGLGSASIGILIDEELKKWAFSDSPHQTEEIESKFKELSSRLQQTLMKMDWYPTKSLLYLGYTHGIKAKLAFIAALAKLNQDSEENFVIVLPGDIDRSEIGKELISKLEEYGIGHFEKINLSDSSNRNYSLPISDTKKKITLLTGTFTYADMHILWMLSEKETLVTGDQSLGEAISANKCYVYDRPDYKKALANNLRSLSHLSSSYNNIIEDNNYNPDCLYRFYKERRQCQYQDMSALNHHICLQKNAAPHIEKIIDNFLKERLKEPPYLIFHNSLIIPDNPYQKIYRKPSAIDMQTIPFDRYILLDGEQILSIKIDSRTKRSLVKEFEDSIFESYLLAYDIYLIKRQKI